MKTNRRARLVSRLAGGVAALAVALMSGSCTSAPVAARPARSVISLNDISALSTLFNRDTGHPRLILIFSPT
jgi:hypothetical protein